MQRAQKPGDVFSAAIGGRTFKRASVLATKQGTTARSADPIRSRFVSGHGGAGLRRLERWYAPCCPLPSRGTVLCWIHA